ncbi:uncharacterized protein K452DRAFT_341865 [Aplosporella prunicola CBS 121167]|uniref:Uncharacterized protein n=1 Tax=Aplosporella prunicola CBS 121167 TaxID=1176127 RepID=A0A6A6AYF2_9PEZI|nr:uncharacterized protein K452DRAFT_341865 [Aplosporella prunicola CBS 121167]KAF2136959.1 hypothetical protein K452DRAFT_341865 [Aplosporella prunicola CBS 121167]
MSGDRYYSGGNSNYGDDSYESPRGRLLSSRDYDYPSSSNGEQYASRGRTRTRYDSPMDQRPSTRRRESSFSPITTNERGQPISARYHAQQQAQSRYTEPTRAQGEVQYTRSGQAYYARIVEPRPADQYNRYPSVSDSRELVLARDAPPPRSAAWERDASARAPDSAYGARYGLDAVYGARQGRPGLDRLAQDAARWAAGGRNDLYGQWDTHARSSKYESSSSDGKDDTYGSRGY